MSDLELLCTGCRSDKAHCYGESYRMTWHIEDIYSIIISFLFFELTTFYPFKDAVISLPPSNINSTRNASCFNCSKLCNFTFYILIN